MDGAEEWEKILGYERILTEREWENVTGKKGDARKNARKARQGGKIPVFVADSIEAAKEGAWVENVVIELRTGIDMQVAHIMKEKNVRALITLDYIRSDFRALQNTARNIRILHKARVPTILASGARRVADLRAPREIAAVGHILGLSIPQALSSVSNNWEGLL